MRSTPAAHWLPLAYSTQPTITKQSPAATSAHADEFIKFVNASPSPFHAVETSRQQLLAAGFKEIRERDSWVGKLQPGGKYFFTRNKSSLTAFAVGGKYQSGNGFAVVGAHTDSPCLKLKPHSKKEKLGYQQVGVQTYGGGLWHTWFDRDLGIAGRVMVKDKDGKHIANKLVRIDKPILRIPTLAIHLDRGVNDAFKFNNEVQLTPVLALTSAAEDALNAKPQDSDATKVQPNKDQHLPLLLKLLSDELGVTNEQIGDFELCLYDVNPSLIGGAQNEFIFSARLDNLMMSFCSLTALVNSCKNKTLETDSTIRVVVLFDNEEIGSVSAHGAGSNLLEVSLRRLSAEAGPDVSGKDSAYERAMTRSLLVSADMAHAVHPNYSEKHEENHRPHMNKGVVIKHNANQRYATTAVSTALLREVASLKNVPLQEFVVRNDSPCGSTIGPMLSAQLGIRTIDVGNPQLSMHSIREQCGVADVRYAVDLFEGFFEGFAEAEARVTVD
ncbi:peptidase M18 [Phlyctochytrium arcticum]|nr:peptidase M18 [Phlyctochytrium arcticum]